MVTLLVKFKLIPSTFMAVLGAGKEGLVVCSLAIFVTRVSE
jgi:hypothetical protein